MASVHLLRHALYIDMPQKPKGRVENPTELASKGYIAEFLNKDTLCLLHALRGLAGLGLTLNRKP